MKIAILGGSFDPPHTGHEHIVRQVSKKFDTQLVYLIPTYRSIFKKSSSANAMERFDMVNLMAQNLKKELKGLDIRVSDFEIKRSVPSKTLRTVQYLRSLHPDANLYFIIGDDHLHTFHKWFRWKQIVTLTNIIVFPRYLIPFTFQKSNQNSIRVSDTVEADTLLPPQLYQCAHLFHFMNAKAINVSSSEIRQKLAGFAKKRDNKYENRDELLGNWLNTEVQNYILEHKLYGTRKNN